MKDKAVRAPVSPEEARKRRNIATALAILGFVIVVFVVTMAKIKGNLNAH